ncbi:MAG: magnesium/cobalt transporter CorA [Candidatus Altiarchaeota archaeon]|nr:magnesium/cobalt transporter CorA [Candidatus Altiarchaeota archaeon]
MNRIAAYTQTESEVRELKDISEVSDILKRYDVVWLDIVFPVQDDMEKLGEVFNFHKLALEDCLHTSQRSKVDNYEDHFFLILKVADYDEKAQTYQLSMFVGRNYIVTVREKNYPDLIKPIFDKIAMNNPGITRNTTDYMCYLLIDAIVDGYFPIFDKIDDDIEDIEARIIQGDSKDSINRIFKLKKDVLLLRKAVFPTMEVVICMQRGDLPNLTKKNCVYFSDVYDHVVEVIDLLETSRELLSGAIDIHMSKTQNAVNEVAKIFAMFAIILMWPTVISGIFGMNFRIAEYESSPDLFYVSLVATVILMIATWAYFKRKNWV